MSVSPPRPPAPSRRAATVQVVMRAHRLAARHLGRNIYSTPAWDILLDLYSDEARRAVSLTSLGGASSAPARTSLRAIERLVRLGLLVRFRDDRDGRRTNVMLSGEAIDLLDQMFDEMGDILRPP